jgi:Lar family restriction alleviation protein
MKSENGCPFCRQQVIDIVESHMPIASEGVQVQCDNCGARGPIYENKEEAITGWELGISDHGKRLRVS